MTEKNQQELSLVKQCELLAVSCSGLYYEPVKESGRICGFFVFWMSNI